jgi:hypothetical protein
MAVIARRVSDTFADGAMKLTHGTKALPEGAADAEQAPEEERWLRCAACGGRITPARARLEVNGSHEHSFMNPSGLRFVVACYAVAPGCVPDGAPSTVWTWFPGRAWQIALCSGCGVHLGWSFHADDTAPFHGLVRDRIV